MLKDTKGIIFDLDGTLVDSMWIWKDIDIEYLGNFGIDLPKDLQLAIEGMSYTETAAYFKKTFDLPRTLDEIKNDWTEMARYKYCSEVPLKEGAADFLKYLNDAHIPVGIATSNGRELVSAVLDTHGITAAFTSVRTSCEVAAGKPAPDIYLKVAADLAVNPEECLVFEDIPNGIMAGKNAGMRVCAVKDQFSLPWEIKKRKLADYYIDNYYDILQNTYEVL